MKWLLENWFLIVAGIAVVSVCIFYVQGFLKRPTEEQLNSVKEWLLWAVTEAEKELGSGTGQLKLRYVYDMFLVRFDKLKYLITFDMVSMFVDEALAKMRLMLEVNKDVQRYVLGEAKDHDN